MTVQGNPRVYMTVNTKPAYRKKKEKKIGKTDKPRSNLLLQDPTGKTCPQAQHRNIEIKRNSSTLNTKNPQREITRNVPSGVANSIMERNFLWLGVYHNIQLDTRNQSFPICKRNQTSNTEGYRIVPCFRQLK